MTHSATSTDEDSFGTRRVRGDGVDLQVAALKPGNAARHPLLCMHGVGRRWQDYLPLAPSLAIRWRIHAADFRGHGGSDRSPGRYRVVDYVRDTRQIVRSLGEPAVLYGHSLGALVAAVVASEVPELVRAVVLEDPPAESLLRNLEGTLFAAQFSAQRRMAGRTDPIAQVARELADVRLPTIDGRATVRMGDLRDAVSLRFSARCLRDLDPEVFTPLLAGTWLDELDLDAAYRRIGCPVLLLCGDAARGGMLARAEADRLVALIPDATRIDFPGVGHLLHWQEPETIAKLVHGFLESL